MSNIKKFNGLLLKRTWTLTDVCGNSKSQDQYLTIQKPDAIETKDFSETGINKVYPVPTSDKVTFNYYSISSGEVVFRIYDITGNLIDKVICQLSAGENSFEYYFKRKGIQQGVYSVVIDSENKRDVKKVVVR